MSAQVRVYVRCDGVNPRPYEGHPGFVCMAEKHFSGAGTGEPSARKRLVQLGWRYEATTARYFCPDHA